ncbi:PilN domain-containing protein [Oscillatoriales cyanobacterium LEGE 11467]|uniref:PilN domain-containing protein n=1 Tax=Zarconia navalis LEGE 11467 TaxID=1828826 RepID=A0A928VXX0_9CYAN|nr:PilN domain-containing protein [Zarconia navalis]MBE9040168.1 PilN domain-containing protein [Zarconia navalis LEGE 11467]
MYSIDINFLNDREPLPETGGRESSRPPLEIPGKAALIAGGGVAVAFLLATAGAWVYFEKVQVPKLEAEKQKLENDLGVVAASEQRLLQIRTETDLVEKQTEALGSVFNYIKPWSALMQDMRDRIPPGVRISTVEQLEDETQAAVDPEAPPSAPPPSRLEIKGYAKSFNDVNDFTIVLQRSSFLQGSQTRLLEATLVDNPNQEIQASEDRFEGELKQVVEYTISTQLSSTPATELLPELQRKGAQGLVDRIKTLQQRGVI